MKMTPKKLRQLIQEVLKEANEPEKPDTTMQHSLAHNKEYETTLTLTLSGHNKKNAHIIRDFIGQLAWEAKKKDLEVIHAELEAQGKIGLEVDEPQIKKSEEEIGRELDTIAAKMGYDPKTGQHMGKAKGDEEGGDKGEMPNKLPSPEQWSKMSEKEREKYTQLVGQGSRAAEWQAASDKDEQDAVERQRRRKALSASGQLKMKKYQKYELEMTKGPDGKLKPRLDHGGQPIRKLITVELPVDTSLWTDQEWDLFNSQEIKRNEKGQYVPNLSKDTARGMKAAIPDALSTYLKRYEK